jgi:5-methylcytosine-specific restriction endonuclease McrA
MLSYLEEWRKDHREESVETARLWRENNPERHSFNNLRWRLNNLERFTHGRIHWRSLNPEKVRLSSRLRKARLRQASIGTLTVELWQERLEEFNFRCAYCLQPLERVTMDHMTPVTQGGLHDITNVVPACGSCNSRKNAKNLLEWLLYLEGIRSCAATQGMGERLAEAIRLAL